MAQMTVAPVTLPVCLVVNGEAVEVGKVTIPMDVSGLKYDGDTGRAYVELVARVESEA